jgi:mannosyltransferase
MDRAALDARDIEVIAANLKRRHTGVTSTIAALLPIQARRIKIAALGMRIPDDWPRISWAGFLRHAWRPPAGRGFRIWHARRNNEMLAGLFLRHFLRIPLKLVFTSAAQRDHTKLTRALLACMDRVIATTPAAASHLRVPADVILHGVDVERCRPAVNRESEWAATGLPGRFGIGVFGRVRKQKGTDLFIEAMCRLLPRHPEFTAIIVGAVTPDQRLFLEALKARVASAGLTHRIRFLGERPPDEVPEWMRRVTIVVGPQRWEGFGLVPIEAMASGAAVVATTVGAAAHLIVEGETGHLVPPGNVEALSERIDRLMTDPAVAISMGQCGRAQVLKHFSIEREAEQIAAVYQSCWNGESATPRRCP